jgi:insulysin
VIDDLNEFCYDAHMAGLGYSIDANAEGLVLNVYGYNDKSDVLLDKVVQQMHHLVVKKERFEVVKDALVRRVKDWKMNDPIDHAASYIGQVLMTRTWTNDEVAQVVEGFTPLFMS